MYRAYARCWTWVLALSFTVAHAAVDVPLIFLVHASGAAPSCLVGINHLVLEPAEKSGAMAQCQQVAEAVAVEVDRAHLGERFWEGYRRRPGDPRFEDLSAATIERLEKALTQAGFAKLEVEALKALHPAAVYRSLTLAQPLATRARLRPNLDITLLDSANSLGKSVIEIEGMQRFYDNDRNIPLPEIDAFVSALCELFLQPGALARYRTDVERFVTDMSAQPDVDTAHEKKLWYNTVALGLPATSVYWEVDERNPHIAARVTELVTQGRPLLIFIGAAHLGGPRGVIKLLRESGLHVQRIQ